MKFSGELLRMKWVSFFCWMIKDPEIRQTAIGALIGHLAGAGFLVFGLAARVLHWERVPSDSTLMLYLLMYIFCGGYFTYLFCITVRRHAERSGTWPN
jgi:hypothetical protein